MKKILAFVLFVQFACLSFGQFVPPPSGMYYFNTTTGKWAPWTGGGGGGGGTSYLTAGIVANLPAASGTTGNVYVINNGASASDCTTGGGSTVVFCYSNGTTYTGVGGSVTAAAIQTALQPLTNCSTTGYTYSPFSGNCVQSTLPPNLSIVATNGGGGAVQATSAQVATLLNGGSAPSPYSVHTTNSSGAGQYTQALIVGTPAITDSGLAAQFTKSVGGYYQWVMQNTSGGSTSSTDIVLNNDLGTSSTFYANFGINSSGFTGAGSLSLPSATYLTGTSGDLVIGTTTANAVHLLANSAATDAITISSANVPTINNPVLAGTPTAPTPAAGDNSTKVPTTAFITSQKGAANGLATLDAGTKVPVAQLPVISGSATVTIAASNSPNQAAANVVCSGTADQTCINTAITTYCPNSNNASLVEGCTILLMNGVFNTTGPVIIDNDMVTLKGIGHCFWGGYYSGRYWTNTSTPVGNIPTGCSQIRASNGTGNFNLIEIQNNNAGGVGTDTVRHRGIAIESLALIGYNYLNANGIYSSTATNHDIVKFYDLFFQRTQHAATTNLDTPFFDYMNAQDISGDAFTFSGIGSILTHSIIYDIGGSCVVTGVSSGFGHENISDNVCGDASNGFIVGGSYDIISDNDFKGIIGNCVSVGSSTGVKVHGNQCNNLATTSAFVANNLINPASDAILLSGSTQYASIVNNTISTGVANQVGWAINATAGSNTLIASNQIIGTFANKWYPISQPNPSSTTVGTNAFVAPAAMTLVDDYKASSIALSSGATVTSWPDSVGSYALTSAYGAPTYQATGTINSGPTVRFNGTTDALRSSSFTIASGIKTYFYVVNASNITTNQRTIMDSAGIGLEEAAAIGTSGNIVVAHASTGVTTSATATANATHVIEWVSGGGYNYTVVDGVKSNFFTTNATQWTTGLIVGGRADASTTKFFAGDIAEVALYTNYSTTTAASAAAALCSAYGVTCGTNW